MRTSKGRMFGIAVFLIALPVLFTLLSSIQSFAGVPAVGTGHKAMATFEGDPALYYALRAALLFDVLGIAVLLYLLLFHKSAFSRTTSKILFGVGIVAFPAVTVAVGNLVALENAKKVEFCKSCHEAMEEYVTDMRDPDNYSLSATHYNNRWINQNQCYGCHTGYGLLGSFNAKIKGLNDVYRYYTGTWKKPIRMKDDFPNKDCLKCHGLGKSYKESKVHKKIMGKLLADKILCAKCHFPMHGKKAKEDVQNAGSQETFYKF